MCVPDFEIDFGAGVDEEEKLVSLRMEQRTYEPGSQIAVRWTADPDADEAYDHRSWDFLALHPTEKGVGNNDKLLSPLSTPCQDSVCLRVICLALDRTLRVKPLHVAAEGGRAPILCASNTWAVQHISSERSLCSVPCYEIWAEEGTLHAQDTSRADG